MTHSIFSETLKSGATRHRVRVNGKKFTIRGEYGSAEFLANYRDLCNGVTFERIEKKIAQSAAAAPPRKVSFMLTKARERSKKKGVPFSLTEAWYGAKMIDQGGRCKLSGEVMRFDKVDGKMPYAPSIDRIDPAKGYTPDNCRLVCVIVNLARLTWPDKVFVKMCRAVAEKAA